MTEVAEAPRQLHALAVAARPDWDRDKTWNALLAAHDAGWPFAKVLREVVRLLLIDDSGPDDLRFAAGETRTERPGSLDADARAEAMAAAEAAAERFRQQARGGGEAA